MLPLGPRPEEDPGIEESIPPDGVTPQQDSARFYAERGAAEVLPNLPDGVARAGDARNRGSVSRGGEWVAVATDEIRAAINKVKRGAVRPAPSKSFELRPEQP